MQGHVPELPNVADESDGQEGHSHEQFDGLTQLRAILLHDEQAAIADIKAHLGNSKQLKIDVAKILSDAVREANKNNSSSLIDAIRAPVVDAIALTSRRQNEDMSNALAPVIGPAIIRSVTYTLKRYTEATETVASHNFTVKGLKWRLEAYRTGLPFSEIVLKHTLLYRVEQVFLIHKASGLLIAHAAIPDLPGSDDKDAIAGMMSAIHSFARDSLSADQHDSLKEVDLGGRILRLMQGPHAMLACVIRGKIPHDFVTKAQDALGEIHHRYHHELREFNGDPFVLADTQSYLEPLLVESKPDSEKESGKPKSGGKWRWILGIVACLLLGYYTWSWLEQREQERIAAAKMLQEQQRKQALEKQRLMLSDTLEKVPGLVVADIGRVGDLWLVKGLLDPLGPTPQQIVARTGLTQEQVQFKLRPYLSLDSDILLKRAQSILAPPSGINIFVLDSKLIVKGEAAAEWIQGARYHARVHLPPYFSQIDLSGVTPMKNSKKLRVKK